MANNGWVKTRKRMDHKQISAILDTLNTSIFKENLRIEYYLSTPENPGWGPHTWLLKYQSNGQEWASRVCWLETDHTFVMRHGGGSYFAWWIDTAILNEIAVYFNGTINDESSSDKWKGESNKYNRFSDYMQLMVSHIKDQEILEQVTKLEYESVPIEFQNE